MSNLYWTIYRRLYDIRHNPKFAIKMFRRDVKFAWQRLTRGWDDSETWSLDCSLAKLILPRLKRFKEVDTIVERNEEFDIILDKMIASFEFIASDAYHVASNKSLEEHAEGLRLFADNYYNLWW